MVTIGHVDTLGMIYGIMPCSSIGYGISLASIRGFLLLSQQPCNNLFLYHHGMWHLGSPGLIEFNAVFKFNLRVLPSESSGLTLLCTYTCIYATVACIQRLLWLIAD